jgi:hypothetical protein
MEQFADDMGMVFSRGLWNMQKRRLEAAEVEEKKTGAEVPDELKKSRVNCAFIIPNSDNQEKILAINEKCKNKMKSINKSTNLKIFNDSVASLMGQKIFQFEIDEENNCVKLDYTKHKIDDDGIKRLDECLGKAGIIGEKTEHKPMFCSLDSHKVLVLPTRSFPESREKIEFYQTVQQCISKAMRNTLDKDLLVDAKSLLTTQSDGNLILTLDFVKTYNTLIGAISEHVKDPNRAAKQKMAVLRDIMGYMDRVTSVLQSLGIGIALDDSGVNADAFLSNAVQRFSLQTVEEKRAEILQKCKRFLAEGEMQQLNTQPAPQSPPAPDLR